MGCGECVGCILRRRRRRSSKYEAILLWSLVVPLVPLGHFPTLSHFNSHHDPTYARSRDVERDAVGLCFEDRMQYKAALKCKLFWRCLIKSAVLSFLQ